MNDHDSILALIPGYPELRTPERQRVDEHAQTCDECAAALQRQQRLRIQLAHAPRLVPDPAVAEAVRVAVRQKASPSATASRAGVRARWLTVAAPAGVFALVAVLVGLLVMQQGRLPGRDALTNRPFGRGQGSLPAAQSAAVNGFVWQTDGPYGYEMLRPAGWAMSDIGSNRVFTAPGSGEEEAPALQVLNLRAKPIAETRWGIGAWRDKFEAASGLADWIARLDEYDFKGVEKATLPEDLTADAVIYVGQTGTRQIQLMAFKVSEGQPLLVSLAGGAPAYDLDALKANGLWDDFLTMLRSAHAIPLDPQNVAPALVYAATSPTPQAVMATRVATLAPEAYPTGPASIVGPVPTPASSLIGSFVIQVAKDYQMLQPLGWEAVDHGTSYSYVAPGSRGASDGIELQVVNYAAQFANRPQTTSLASAEWLAFQQNPTLSGWTAAMVLSWPSLGLQPVELRELPEAIIYTYEFPNSHPPARALVAYKVDRGQPLGVMLTAKGAYADLDRLQREGLLDDFVTMVESLRATDADRQPVAPAVATVAPALLNPTVAPQATPTNGLPATCAVEAPNTLLLASGESGYCLRYPAAFRPRFGTVPDWPAGTWGVSFYDPNDANRTVSLLIETSLTNGRTLDQVVTEELAHYRNEVAVQADAPSQLGGERVVILDGLPGVLMNRQAFVIHGDRLHHLVLLPWQDAAFADRQIEAQALWDQVVNTLAFVPALDVAQLGRLLQDDATAVVLQRVKANDLAAELRATELTESELAAEVCLDLPDNRDWQPMPRLWLSQGERQIEVNHYGVSLVDGKLTQTAYATHRCYRFSFQLQSPGFSVVEPFTFSIERLALEPNEGEVGQIATCEAALRRLAERQPDLRAECVDRGDGTFPEPVSLPEGMTRDQGQRLIYEGYSEFVDGPWTFTIPMTNINPTQP